tara:strand:- start:1144 stop:1617 length:474 start_codon:yes stop_codon:yes gene_type:complete
MKKILLLILFPFNLLYAIEVTCNFEEVYQNSEVQQGIFLIKNKMLRYQYYKHDLFTILAKNNKFLIVNNHSKVVQKLNNKTESLEALLEIISDYPNINNSYEYNEMFIKIEKSKKKFLKRVSIQSDKLNLSINIMNCKFNKIDKKYFRHFDFVEFKG